MPDGDNLWIRENFQRNCITRGLKNSGEDDLIIISENADDLLNYYKAKLFENNKDISIPLVENRKYLKNVTLPDWYGSRICKKRYLKSPQWLRNLKFKKRPFWRIDKLRLNNIIEEGGWHFCNLKTPINLVYKYQNMAETKDEFFEKME